MILHIMIYDKFTKNYIERINKLYDKNSHCFVIRGNKIHDGVESVAGNNVYILNNFKNNCFKYLFLLNMMVKSQKIILHSLFLDHKFLRMLNLMIPMIRNKYVWVVWGGDLYDNYWNRGKDLRYENERIKFIKNLKNVCVIPIRDYAFLNDHYKTKAKLLRGIYSYVLPNYEIKKDQFYNNSTKKLRVLLANSATKTCQYEDAMQRINKIVGSNVAIYCILSYPKDKTYISQIITMGQSMFAESFIPITEFMDDSTYTSFLSSMDIVIFNHNRQQAFGNIMKSLYLGKKIFVNPLNPGLEFFAEIGCKVFSTDELTINALENLPYQDAVNNQRAIVKYYSDDNFKALWDEVFK